MAAGVPRYVFPMGARPWLLEYRAMCLYVILISDFPFTIIATMCVGIADTNALVTTMNGRFVL